MAYLQHVNGPAVIEFGGQGTLTGSLATLGIAENGVALRFIETTEDVGTDASGPTPADVQMFQRMCLINFRLVVWDNEQLAAFLNYNNGAVNFPYGASLPPGFLMGQNGFMKTVRIQSPYIGSPYRFPFCHFIGGNEVGLGTRRSGWDVSLRAITGVGSNADPAGIINTSNQTLLFNNL